MVVFQGVFDDRQAKACAAGIARAADIHAVESLGQPGQVLFRNAAAGIGYPDPDVAPGRQVLHHEAAVGLGMGLGPSLLTNQVAQTRIYNAVTLLAYGAALGLERLREDLEVSAE